MQGFIRMTKLSNIVGRANYISSTDRQECIVAASEPVDWKPYQDFERQNRKTDQRNNEGREVIIALPNEWADLRPDELKQRAATVASTAVGKTTDLQWAVHWNKTRTNLHLHVIFSERKKTETVKRWDRDVYLTADGKVARRKADRACGSDGTVLPPVHRKGDLQASGFTVKDTRYKDMQWWSTMKERVTATLSRLGATLDDRELIPQFHQGKGSEAPLIRAKNDVIKINNELWKRYQEVYPGVDQERLKELLFDAALKGQVLRLYRGRSGLMMDDRLTLEEWQAQEGWARRAWSEHYSRKTPEKSSVLSKLNKYRQEMTKNKDSRSPVHPFRER